MRQDVCRSQAPNRAVVNYAERKASVAGRAAWLTDIEYRLLFELSASAGRVLTHDQLQQRIVGPASWEWQPDS